MRKNYKTFFTSHQFILIGPKLLSKTQQLFTTMITLYLQMPPSLAFVSNIKPFSKWFLTLQCLGKQICDYSFIS